MNLAVIMARGGSKRLPRKNVKPFAGKPAVAWPVGAALESGLFDSVIISTDDDEIARAACEAGAAQPFKRPAELSNDHATTLDVVRHAVATLGSKHEFCCCLYGTSVFATPELLKKGRELLEEAVMCAVIFEHPPQRGFSIDDCGRAEFIDAANFGARTQDRTPIYHDVGLFYWFRVSALMDTEKKSLADFSVRPLVLPRGAVVDIDTEEDWAEAERIVSKCR